MKLKKKTDGHREKKNMEPFRLQHRYIYQPQHCYDTRSSRVLAANKRNDPDLNRRRPATKKWFKETYSTVPHKKKVPIDIADHQKSTRNSSYIDEFLLPSPQRKNNNFIVLRTKIHSSSSIFRSHIGKDHPIAKCCVPIMETIQVKRNHQHMEKWEKITSPPEYFERMEADANIYENSKHSTSSFRRAAARLGLCESVQKVILQYDMLKRECSNCIRNTYRVKIAPNHWWPVGLDLKRMDPKLLHIYSDENKIINVINLAKDVFKLSDSAISNVEKKKTSLLYEVHTVCRRWHIERRKIEKPSHVPDKYASTTIHIGDEERFLEVKVGVYYVLETGSVIKFMLNPESFVNFVMETAIGCNIEDKIKGTVGIKKVCPEAFCIEMDFAGVSLNDVINGDVNCTLNLPEAEPQMIQHHMLPNNMEGGLYGVRMLQVTGRLPQSLQGKCPFPIVDSYSATAVINTMRKKLLDELPFVIAEIVNIVTRLSQQGLVNPDIKCDNVVIDGLTGQPKMIDFGLVLPAGKRDSGKNYTSYTAFPQSAPEYLERRPCQEGAMTYGLSVTVNEILNTLARRTGDMAAVSMSVNIPLRTFLTKAYAPDFTERPRAYKMGPRIGACFPFKPNILKLFSSPKHTITNSPLTGVRLTPSRVKSRPRPRLDRLSTARV